MAQCVLYELVDHVATITYNRPERMNAINRQMRHDLNDAFLRFRDDDEAWIAIVTGAGRAFCAGADLKDPDGSTGDFKGSFFEKPTVNSFESGWEIYKPVIAAVNGPCIGYGLTLVTWCDFVIASDRARFGYPEAALGMPAIVGAVRLPQRVAWPDAMAMLMTGETIDAEEALKIGLAWRVVAHDELIDAARQLAERLKSGAPIAQRAMKEMAMRAHHMSSPEAIRVGEAMRLIAGSSADAREGLAAAAEKRRPVWQGR